MGQHRFARGKHGRRTAATAAASPRSLLLPRARLFSPVFAFSALSLIFRRGFPISRGSPFSSSLACAASSPDQRFAARVPTLPLLFIFFPPSFFLLYLSLPLSLRDSFLSSFHFLLSRDSSYRLVLTSLRVFASPLRTTAKRTELRLEVMLMLSEPQVLGRSLVFAKNATTARTCDTGGAEC